MSLSVCNVRLCTLARVYVRAGAGARARARARGCVSVCLCVQLGVLEKERLVTKIMLWSSMRCTSMVQGTSFRHPIK